MARYENNQRIVGFIRRLPADFGGFHSQTVSMSGESIQMLHGQMIYRKVRIFVAIYARPGQTQDSVVLSLPFFHIPESGSTELFEKLLSWNNGATEGVHFSIDEPLKTINVVCVRPIEGTPYQEFQYCVENMVSVISNSAELLQREFGLMRIGA